MKKNPPTVPTMINQPDIARRTIYSRKRKRKGEKLRKAI